MAANTALLRTIPKVDEVLASPLFDPEQQLSHSVAVEAIRAVLEETREAILAGSLTEAPTVDGVALAAAERVRSHSVMSLRRLINGTGIVLHTNLGRARLGEKVTQAVCDVAMGYSTLEYDVAAGRRGSRYSHIEELVTRLTGAESALVVNNNAAAVMLILGAMTKGKEVVISRGELVEIGGSFRVPEIMEQSGSILVEVGSTNKTHLSDYEKAITENTGAFLKVHTSNFRILGFTESVPTKDMVEVAHAHGLPVIHDLGSGVFVNLEQFGILDEPTVQQCLDAGVDVLSFSGDKLLGGPQAGIIIGKKKYIDQMKKHPLTRALRVDKMTLAALEATLRLYLDPRDAMEEIPTLKILAVTLEQLEAKANRLRDAIAAKTSGCALSVIEELGQVGGGSVPTQMLKSRVVAIVPSAISVMELEKRLRACPVPVIGRINKDQYLLDVRTIEESDFDLVAENIAACVQ
ncbi:L-seryl-tRNA(Sec) selenium transferase [Merdimmobilis hominis]|uniref:L-seryl-tRNA(Sec) selenium transferase n=1 Tax=Merdimmobilis hominis TaxID=2897707 RepID=UPI0032D27C5F